VEKRYGSQRGAGATVNDQIRALDEGAAGWADPEQRFGFLCECEDERLRRARGDEPRRVRARAQPARSLCSRSGHQADAIEQVVEQNDRFFIVDKRGAVEHLVELLHDESVRAGRHEPHCEPTQWTAG
jgi:hypothetical protein